MSETYNRIESKEKVYKESFCAPEARILVVDDTRMNLIVMKELLKQTEMQIDTAFSGMECLFLAERNQYHIIFLDIKMPEMDGSETLQRLLAQEGNKNIPVIALTADDLPGAKEEYITDGFSDYLSKPVDPEKLQNIMLQYLPVELVRKMKTEDSESPISDGGTEWIPDIAGLDPDMGIQACGTVGTFQKALKEFYITAEDRIQEIEQALNKANYKIYTIKVHTLKSSARLVGARMLSEMAQYLEECGNHENIQEIKQKTAALVEHYTALAEAIGADIKKKEHSHERPVIEWESLWDALHTIYELAAAFDFDSADSVLDMLEEYVIPDEYHETMQKLKVLLIDAKRDDIMQLIKQIEKKPHPEPDATDDAINIPDIDAKSALKAFGGSLEEYLYILKVFTQDEKERLEQMEECIRTENIELYTVYAHSIKSSAAIIGAAALSKLAEQLEMAGKEGDFEYIRGRHNEFLVKANHIIEDLISFLQQQSGLDDQEKEQGSKEFLRENLVKIEGALMDYEIDMAEDSLSQLNSRQWSEAISIMISEISQKIMTFDYEEAQLLVGKLLKM